jgi:hypothetical protein
MTAMTEAEWLACRDPRALLAHLEGKASARKLRLFAAACCRRIWRLLTDPRSRDAVEVSERYADGLATKAELAGAVTAAEGTRRRSHGSFGVLPLDVPVRAAQAAYIAAQGSAADAVAAVQFALAGAAGAMAWRSAAPGFAGPGLVRSSPVAVDIAEREAQCRLAREFWGNPFRTVEFEPAWRTANESAVSRLARALYDERDFDQLPVLADALEEAGCSSRDLLDHLRGPGPHVRGCWALDLALDRK